MKLGGRRCPHPFRYVKMSTREWQDGILSKTMRSLGQIPDTLPKWIVLDGDLDANWIESMNSVMDDNRILTLASNERIPLKPHMRMIFEIRDLNFASPATVSRAGIIFVSDSSGASELLLSISNCTLGADSSLSTSEGLNMHMQYAL